VTDPIPADQLLDQADAILLRQVIRDAENYGRQMQAVLHRSYGPADPLSVAIAEGHLKIVRAAVDTALGVLGHLADIHPDLQPPAHQDSLVASTGGPGQNHPWPPAGEGPTPGPAAAATVSESAGDVGPGAGDSFSLPRPPDFDMRAAVARIRDGRA